MLNPLKLRQDACKLSNFDKIILWYFWQLLGSLYLQKHLFLILNSQFLFSPFLGQYNGEIGIESDEDSDNDSDSE